MFSRWQIRLLLIGTVLFGLELASWWLPSPTQMSGTQP